MTSDEVCKEQGYDLAQMLARVVESRSPIRLGFYGHYIDEPECAKAIRAELLRLKISLDWKPQP